MKTKTKILDEIAKKNDFDNWDDLQCDAPTGFTTDCIREAMEEYASECTVKMHELIDAYKELIGKINMFWPISDIRSIKKLELKVKQLESELQ
jgi:hypothetical protein